jgi:CotH kinase protein/Lamin Tail Domain
MRHSAGKQLRRTLRGFEQLEPRLMLAAQPIISEFMASNNGSIQDGFGKHSDWIELTNAGDTPVNLQGYYLSDSVSNLTKWSFPASTIVNPGQYLIVFASGNNTVDPLGYYHTNYKLDADGEHVVLAAPDQTILSQFSTDGSSYPAQVTDISYGLSGTTLVSPDTASTYQIPTNGNLGTTWTGTNFIPLSNGFTTGKASVGYDTTTTPINYANYFKTTLPNATTSVYVRTEFNLDNAAAVSSLNLNLKYDDGVVVYLNGTKVASNLAPASPVWNSLATGSRDDSLAIAGNDLSLNAFLGLLQSGKNVLAIQLLNQNNSSSDLLLAPVLTAQSSSSRIGYLATPTPGAANSALAQIGPMIDPVVVTPNQPIAGQPITITAQVAAFTAAVNPASVALTFRVMYNSESHLVMFDDGVSGGDAVAGDGVYTVQIPGAALIAGQMVRWYVTAADVNGVTSRAPSFVNPLDSPQYYGTVVVDPSVKTNLPVIYWFVQDTGAAATDTGTRASLFFGGQFYDNIEVDLHGQSTTQPQFTKKSFNFDANSGLKFQFDGTFGDVSDFNLLTNLTDKTYVRNSIAYGLYGEAGGPALDVFSAVVQRNGSYYGLYDVDEEAQSEYLERVGLDPDGALYKMGNAFDSTTIEVEKKTRKYEGNSDLQQLVNTSLLSTTQGETWIDDNLDLASWVNYFAVQTLIANRDYGQKNYYLYRDSNNTQLWSLLPWDMDLSFGHQWNQNENYFDDDLIFNDGLYVYQGGNQLINRLIALPQFTQMYERRLKTLTDEFFGPPGQDISSSSVVAQINTLISQIGADALVDRNHWGAAAGMAYETPTQAVARVETDYIAKRKTVINSLPGVPTSQVANPNVTFGTIDFNPASANQNQEYIAIVNHSSTAVDISDWSLSGAVSHTFEGGTVIPANATYYAVADVAQFKLRVTGPAGGQKLFIQGNFDGRLNDTYGQLSLKDATGATITSTTYGTPPLPGDFDSSGTVDAQDYNVWLGTFGSASDLRADGNLNGIVDAGDYTVWRDHLGTTYSPGSGAAAMAVPQQAIAPAASLVTAESIAPSAELDSLPHLAESPSPSRPLAESLVDGVFQSWADDRGLALLTATAQRWSPFHRSDHHAAHHDNTDSAATDVALADLLTVGPRLL